MVWKNKLLKENSEKVGRKIHQRKFCKNLAYGALNIISKNCIEIIGKGQNGEGLVSPQTVLWKCLNITANIDTEIVCNQDIRNIALT